MKNIFRIISFVLIIVMAFSAVACSSADTSYAMTVDSTQVPAGIYVGYIIDEYLSASTLVENPDEDIFAQQIEDENVEDRVLRLAHENAVRHVIIDNKFDELGLEFNEIDEQSALQIQQSLLSESGDFFERNGCSNSSLLEIARNTIKANRIFNYYYSVDGEKEVSDEDVKEYFEENYVEARIISVQYVDITGATLSDELLAEANDKADEYYKRLQDGEDYLEIFNEYQVFYYESQGLYNYAQEVTDEELLYSWYSKDGDYSSDDLKDAIFESEIDQAFFYEDETSAVIGIRNDNYRDEEYYEDSADGLRFEMKGDEFQEDYMDVWTQEAEYQNNDAAISRYSPRNVK